MWGRFPVSRAKYPIVLSLLLVLSGCASAPHETSTAPVAVRPAAAPLGVPLLKDGTPAFRADMLSIADAVPRPEPVTAAGNKSPYTVLGNTYRITAVAPGHRERGYGSWYGTKFHGQNTSNGEPYDVYSMTAAHKTLPIPSYVRVTNLENGRRIVVRVNDRGPFHDGRVIDLSYAAAYRLGYADRGTALVELEVLDPNAPEWVARRSAAPSPAAGSERKTYLQAGAFRSVESARNLQQALVPLLAQNVSIHANEGWYRVRVGPLDNTETLHEAQRRIAAASLGATQVVTE